MPTCEYIGPTKNHRWPLGVSPDGVGSDRKSLLHKMAGQKGTCLSVPLFFTGLTPLNGVLFLVPMLGGA